MRKNYLIIISLIVVGLGIYYTQFGDTLNINREFKTSEMLIQEHIDAKIERRKNGYAKQDKPDKFLEHIYMLKTGGNPDADYKINNAFNELKKAKLNSTKLKGIKTLDWKQRGPGNVGGRTRGLVIDPDDATGNTWFTGPVGGGVWKTTDAGLNWTLLTSDWPNLSVASLIMAESNHDVFYAGTGEGFGNVDAIKGNGIFKSIDRGQSWTQLASTKDDDNFSFVSRLVIDPSNENIVLAATNSGLFRSIDGGLSWTNVYEAQEKVQDLRAKPGDFSTLFATDNNIGILMSIDGGQSWNVTKAINKGRIELAISSNNPEYLYALTSTSDLFMSVDGGDNWEETTPDTKVEFLSQQGWYNNTLVVNPNDATKLYVGGLETHSVSIGEDASSAGSSVFDIKLSNTSFLSWLNIGGEYLAGGIKMETENATLYTDVEITFGAGVAQKAHRFTTSSSSLVPAASDLVYQDYVDVPFSVTDKTSGQQLMVSFVDSDANGTFEPKASSTEQIYIHAVNYDNVSASAMIASAGGATHNRIVVLNPNVANDYTWDAANLPAATITLDTYELKSKNITSSQLTVWYAKGESYYSHADHHNMAIIQGVGNPFRIVDCNDGGVFMSEDGGVTWEERVAGYVTSQFYGVSKHPTKDIYIGGLQDNGTWMSPEDPDKLSEWTEKGGGDGFETAWNANDPNKIALSLYNNRVKISNNGGQSWFDANIGDQGDDAPFVTRIANEVSEPDLMFVGGASGVWRSPDFGATWNLVTMPNGTWSYGHAYPHIAISPVDSKFVFAGNALSSSNALAYSTDGGLSFESMPIPNGAAAFISELIAHPTNEKGIYVLFAQNNHPKILYTENNGGSWTDLSQFETGTSSNGFPNVAVYSLVVMPHNTDILWAGTEIGIFESIDGGQSWHYADNGLPAVCIWDMKIVGQQVVVATHGLGVWTVDIPEILDAIKKPLVKAGKNPLGEIAIELQLESAYDLVEVYFNDELVKTYENTSIGVMNDAIEYASSHSLINVKVKGKIGDTQAVSSVVDVENYNLYAPVQKYMNPFTTNQYDFTGASFSISDQLFDNWAIHSVHPYSKDEDIVYMLNYPIEVMENADNSILTYRDIALVEAGQPGASYGDDAFYDYVVVEGTKDGITWQPLEDGYDVNAFDSWKEFASSGISSTPNSSTLFEQHSINLQQTFEAGDVILIRFRLYSDDATTGYGWVIDDLNIQESSTESQNLLLKGGKNPQGSVAIELELKQNYSAVELYFEDNLIQTYNDVSAGIINEEIAQIPNKASVNAYAKGFVNGQLMVTDYIEIVNYELNDPIQKYMTSFDTNHSDFIGESFAISKELFDNYAIHSEHSYSNNMDITYMLTYPIEVMEAGKAILSYQDIAMIESEGGDYVVLEGSVDGYNWKSLNDTYNVSDYSEWSSVVSNINSAPTSKDLFVEHTINLLDNFNTGDVILLRFRLHSDEMTSGYGWVIDNLIVQETGTAVEEEVQYDTSFTVGPNPATDHLEIKLNSRESGNVNVSVYDMSGRAVIVQDYYKGFGVWNQTIELGSIDAGVKIVTVSLNGKIYKKKIICR
ncbi:T9SS type A sorting domain-containing protein [Carboxylicivirga sp. A043]|uniref:VPS10 domain-containing protein n=1 Tax=Carboxylicivirga litoralis TaxID=2816963 RepID=UPI0021CB4EB5|nr:T9SS type A sorting domain-containing protein [Carboxylicivirga sp. A043]MCU4157807.1 T9SS type A sorting domain-containing protein [Carboxylicivirga sp. A043]